jgi:hypothetical protein
VTLPTTRERLRLFAKNISNLLVDLDAEASGIRSNLLAINQPQFVDLDAEAINPRTNGWTVIDWNKSGAW